MAQFSSEISITTSDDLHREFQKAIAQNDGHLAAIFQHYFAGRFKPAIPDSKFLKLAIAYMPECYTRSTIYLIRL